MKFDIIRAWKDESYRSSLSSQEQAMLPENPAGALDLSDAELETIQGAANVGGDASTGCTAGQQLGVAANVPILLGGLLGNSDATGNDCVH
jgi:mersacidin/lichenicidin family type 2 lantibiotic